MTVVQINYVFENGVRDPEALLTRYSTLTGWSEALAASGAGRVTVIQRFDRNATLTRNGIDYVFCRDDGDVRPRPWTWPRHLHRAMLRARPDIVHVNGLICPWQTWLLRRILPRPTAIVVQDHGSLEPDVGAASVAWSFRRTVRRRAMHAPDGFLFTAAEQAETWRQAGLIARGQGVYQVMEASTACRSVPRAEARQRSGVGGSPAILWVGRLNANKDPLTILEGFEQCLADLPNALLTMVYSAEDLLPEVHERVRASSALQTRVRLVCRVAHQLMPAFYSAADLFVLGSHREGSGYALLEALACGVVPVVTDIPTFRVITAGGSLGALWTPGNSRSFARALLEVGQRDMAACRAQIGDYFERELSWPAVGRQAMAAYEHVVARRRMRLGQGGR